jgi:hypothetical protein
MPELNRRRFLQFAGAAGLAPIMPALPASAAASSGTVTSSQMLWASLYAKAGNAQNAQGIYAKLVQNQLLTAHTANTLRGTLRSAPVQAQPATEALRPKSISVDIEKLLGDTAQDETDLISQESIEEIEGLDQGA